MSSTNNATVKLGTCPRCKERSVKASQGKVGGVYRWLLECQGACDWFLWDTEPEFNTTYAAMFPAMEDVLHHTLNDRYDTYLLVGRRQCSTRLVTPANADDPRR